MACYYDVISLFKSSKL